MSKLSSMTLAMLFCCVAAPPISAADKKAESLSPDPFLNIPDSKPDESPPAKFRVTLQVLRPNRVPAVAPYPGGFNPPTEKAKLSTSASFVSLECEQVTCEVKVNSQGEPEYRLGVTGPVLATFPEMRIQASEAAFQEGKLQLKTVEMTTGPTILRSAEMEIELVVIGVNFGLETPAELPSKIGTDTFRNPYSPPLFSPPSVSVESNPRPSGGSKTFPFKEK